MILFRIVIVIATLIGFQNIATFLVPILQPGALSKGISIIGLLMLVGFIFVPLASPFLWLYKKSGIYILSAGTILVYFSALFYVPRDSTIQALSAAFGFALFHFIFLFLSLVFFYNHQNKIQA